MIFKKYFFLFCIVISSALSGSVSVSKELDQIVSFFQCESHELKIVLNKDNEATKKDLIQGLKAVGSYYDFVATPIATDNQELHFTLKPASCRWVDQEYICEEPRSWGEIQWRLKTIKATEVSCAEPSAPKQEAQEEEDQNGGVTGENGN